MTSPTPLENAVAAHGRELAVLRALVGQAAADAVGLYGPWHRTPKGSALSAMTRDRFLELSGHSADLAGSGVAVRSCGEDWVRIWLPKLSWLVPLRARPRIVRVEEPGLFPDDMFGPALGSPVLFWRWDTVERKLASFSLARVTSMDNWVLECPVLESIDIRDDLAAMPAGRLVPAGGSNEDDDLAGVVGRWDREDPVSEAEHTDELRKDTRDDNIDPAMGADGS
jgi:hypothetical protein